MKTKERIIRQAIDENQRRVSEINHILESNPLSEICNIRIEAQKLLDENKTLEQRMSEEFMNKIKSLAQKEKEQFELAEKAKDSLKLLDEKCKLEFELSDLEGELFHIIRKKAA